MRALRRGNYDYVLVHKIFCVYLKLKPKRDLGAGAHLAAWAITASKLPDLEGVLQQNLIFYQNLHRHQNIKDLCSFCAVQVIQYLVSNRCIDALIQGNECPKILHSIFS